MLRVIILLIVFLSLFGYNYYSSANNQVINQNSNIIENNVQTKDNTSNITDESESEVKLENVSANAVSNVHETNNKQDITRESKDNQSSINQDNISQIEDIAIIRKNLASNFLDTDIIYGNKEAPVKIIVYSSFSCPGCAMFFNKIMPILEEKYINHNQVALTNRSYVVNNQDLLASMLVRCKLHNVGPNLSRVLYKQQYHWVSKNNYPQILSDIARLAGIKEDIFNKCMESQDIKQYLLLTRMQATKYLNINAYPTVYVNGEEMANGLQQEELFRLIDSHLANTNQSNQAN